MQSHWQESWLNIPLSQPAVGMSHTYAEVMVARVAREAARRRDFMVLADNILLLHRTKRQSLGLDRRRIVVQSVF